MSRRKLTINRNTQSLVSVPGRTGATGLTGFQTNETDFSVQVIDDSDTTIGQAAEIVDLSTFGMRAVLYLQATGTEGDESANTLVATYEAGWAWDVTTQSMFGTLDFHTAEIAAFLGENDLASARMEINLVKPNGRYETVLQIPVSLRANADIGAATAPASLAAPPTTGKVAIQNGVGGVTIADNVVTVAGLGLGFTPSDYLLFFYAPAGSGPITGDLINGSVTSDSFSFILTAIPENNNYFVRWIPLT